MSCLRKLIWIADFYRGLGVCMSPLYVCVCDFCLCTWGGGTYIFLYVYMEVGAAAGTRVHAHVEARG